MRKKIILFKTADELAAGYGLNSMDAEAERTQRTVGRHVYLRARKLAGERLSLYLYFCRDGERQRLSCGKHLILSPEIDMTVKGRNIETMRLGKAIAEQKDSALQHDLNGFSFDGESLVKIVPYIDKMAKTKLAEQKNRHSSFATLNALKRHIAICFGEDVRFKSVNKRFVETFIDYLTTATNQNFQPDKEQGLSQNSQRNLFVRLNGVLCKAKKEKLIKSNPIADIDSAKKPKAEKDTRTFLELDELRALIQTYCRNDQIKLSFLFSCFCGLRYSDLQSITWGNFERDSGGDVTLHLTIVKTKREERFPLSAEALQFLPKRNGAKDEERVFRLPKNDSANKQLARWIKSAGITKKITFHCARHTAATLNLSLGIPVETVGKLLGHRKIATTMIYADLLSEAKREAVNKQNRLSELLGRK